MLRGKNRLSDLVDEAIRNADLPFLTKARVRLKCRGNCGYRAELEKLATEALTEAGHSEDELAGEIDIDKFREFLELLLWFFKELLALT